MELKPASRLSVSSGTSLIVDGTFAGFASGWLLKSLPYIDSIISEPLIAEGVGFSNYGCNPNALDSY